MNDYIEEFKQSIAANHPVLELINYLTLLLEDESKFHTNPSEWIKNSINTIWEKIKTSEPETVKCEIDNAVKELAPAYNGMCENLFEVIYSSGLIVRNYNQPFTLTQDEFSRRREYYGYEFKDTCALVDSRISVSENGETNVLSVYVYKPDDKNILHLTKNIKVINYGTDRRYLVEP